MVDSDMQPEASTVVIHELRFSRLPPLRSLLAGSGHS